MEEAKRTENRVAHKMEKVKDLVFQIDSVVQNSAQNGEQNVKMVLYDEVDKGSDRKSELKSESTMFEKSENDQVLSKLEELEIKLRNTLTVNSLNVFQVRMESLSRCVINLRRNQSDAFRCIMQIGFGLTVFGFLLIFKLNIKQNHVLECW